MQLNLFRFLIYTFNHLLYSGLCFVFSLWHRKKISRKRNLLASLFASLSMHKGFSKRLFGFWSRFSIRFARMLHRLHNRRSEHSQANCALSIQITSQVNVVFVLSEQKPKQARGRHEQHNPNGPDGDAAYEQFAEHFSSRPSLTRLVSLISLIVPSGLKVENKIEHKLLVN